jgi:carbonic anhydrase/acetyltransferase-like protein (isoleucine patch superfamily)
MGNDCYLAENATVVGDVLMGDECSVWFNAVVRGDVNSIVMGNRVNIQDGAVIHSTYQKAATTIGNNVSIGHNALVHGCTIHDNVLIGMGSIVMDNCVVESNSIVAAGAVLLEGTRVESWSVYAGVPAKKVKVLSKELFEGEVQRIANNYVMYASWFK